MVDDARTVPVPGKRRGGIGARADVIEVTVPTLPEVRAWIGVSVASMSDEQLTVVIDAEVALQAATCDLTPAVPPPEGTPGDYPPEMRQALYRRCARQVAARGLPLGLTDVVGEYGPARIPTYDAEIARLEASRRFVVVA
jgi:hypothetical protein